MRGQRNLNRLTYFAAVVENGSFTAASNALGITKAVVSQQVAKLEEETGAALLIRTTRRVQPTEAGKDFYARCLEHPSRSGKCFRSGFAGEHKADRPTSHYRAAGLRDHGRHACGDRLQAGLSRVRCLTDARGPHRRSVGREDRPVDSCWLARRFRASRRARSASSASWQCACQKSPEG